MEKPAVINDRRRRRFLGVYLKNNWQLYLMLMVPVVFVIIFKYAAYPGLRIAFMDYKPAKGYAGSKWVGLETFEKIFRDKDFSRALKNSLVFNFLDLLVGFPVPIILALLLNELRFTRYKKVSQTILYLPHFLSWVIIASVALNLFKPETGLINILLKNAGMIEKGIPFLTEKWHWAVTYLLIGVWQNMGWGSIIYLAAITGIDGQLYEAATIDGAGRFRRLWHVSLPGILPTITILLIMQVGGIMAVGSEKILLLYSPSVYEKADVISTYIYRRGLSDGKYGLTSAVGLFESVINMALLLAADRFSKLVGQRGLF